MTEAQGVVSAKPADPFKSLQRTKAARLRELMKRKPGQKGYKQALRAYLDADGELQKAIIKRLHVQFH